MPNSLAARSAVLLAAGLGSVLVMAVLSGVRLDAEMTELALARRESLAFLTAATLRERFDRSVDVGVSLATRVRFRELVKEERWEEAISIMKDVPRDLPSIDRIFLADPAGVLRADIPALPEVRNVNFADRDWFKGVTAAGKPYVSKIYRRRAEPRVNVIAVAIPVLGDSNARQGILVLQIRLDTLYAWASEVRVGDEGFVSFVDPQGQAVGRPGQAASAEPVDVSGRPFIRRVLAGERGIGVSDGQLVVYEPVPGYGWGIAVEQPERVAFGSRRRGLLTLAVIYAIILAGNGTLAWLLVRAFRQRVRTEAALHSANRNLEAANADLESFSYSVSHDLRAPLRAIDGYSRMLEEDCDAARAEPGRRYISVIRQNAQQMGQLIDDLLAFSRLGRKAVEASPVDLERLADGVWAEIRAAQGERPIEFRRGPLPPVRGDASLLRQVFFNLLSNAAKYTRGRTPAVIEVSGRRDGGEAIYTVKDNGVGFQQEYAHKLFAVFQRLHSAREFEGTGIGLALVHRIISRHGGRVWGEGKVGEGAVFHFTLPTSGGDHEQSGSPGDPAGRGQPA